MGIASSTTSTSEPSQLRQDLKYLGDRMPFGDGDLYHIHQLYHQYQHSTSQPQQASSSFVTEIGVTSRRLVSEQQQQQRRKNKSNNADTTNEQQNDDYPMLLQAMEQRILPPGFGTALYRSCFLRPQDMRQVQQQHKEVDEYTRLARLEAFAGGLSNASRRGNSKALTVLIRACTSQKDSNVRTSEGVDPIVLVTWAYHISLAAGFLASLSSKTITSDYNEDTSGTDFGRYLPPTEDNSSTKSGLDALAASLSAFAKTRRQDQAINNLSPAFSSPHGTTSHPPSSVDDELVYEEEIQEWVEQVAPMLASSLSTFLHWLFFPHQPLPPSRSHFEFPNLSGFASTFFSIPSSPRLFAFACMSPSLSGEYYRLYTSASDGLSFNRLQNALLGYSGPTLIVIQSRRSIFGAFTASPWKESKDFYGNTDCFLYQLQPTTAVYRPSNNHNTTNGRTPNLMYCNSFARSRGYDKQAHGIGFGGSVNQPRLFLAESFDQCWAGSQDVTFENGPLLALEEGASSNDCHFEIDSLEVWGVGGTAVVQDALGDRRKQRDIKQAAINKARKVDKAAFLDDFRSGLIESKAFAHQGQIQGRAGTSSCMDENDDQGKK